MSSSTPIYRFLFRADWKLLIDALQLNPEKESDEFLSAAELTSTVNCDGAGLIICSLRDKADLIQLATFVKSNRKLMKDSYVKIIVVNFSGDHQFDQAISKLGILDVIEPKITMKALRFKIDLCLKSLNTQTAKAYESDTKKHTDLETQLAQKKPHELILSWLDPLDCLDDIWLISKDSSSQKIGEKWLLSVMGPGPETAHWTPVKDKLHHWIFEFQPGERKTFMTGTGHWYFRGEQKPEFNWKEKAWMLTGVSLELYYQDESHQLIRLRSQEKTLNLCRNSVAAISKEDLLLTSIKNATDHLKSGEKLSGRSSTDHLRHDPLSGRSSTDHLDHSPLKGETSLSMDLSSDPLSGRTTTEKFNNKGMELRQSTNTKEGDLLSLRQDNAAVKTHYINHNTTEVFSNRDLGLNHKTENIDGFYSGSVNSDNVIPLQAKVREESLETLSGEAKVSFLLGQNGLFLKASFEDYFDGRLTLKTSDAVLGTGMVDLKVNAQYLGTNVVIDTRALLVSVAADEDGEQVFDISVPEEGMIQFEKFTDLISQRQKNAQLFISKVRGL